MKKTYQTPETKTMHFETCVMQNASLGVYSDSVNSESDLLSRGRNRNVWDDEEE